MFYSPRHFLSTASLAVVAAIGLAGCVPVDAPATELMATPLATPQSAQARATAGDIVRVTSADAGSLGSTDLVIYRSTDGATGTATKVSGAFFLPPGTPPPGGWPVVAIWHGTTGLTPDCGPTASPTALDQVGPVKMLLDRGFAVTVVDFQGLGIAGESDGASASAPAHPYLEPRSAAYDLADSVRALRTMHPGLISNRWAAAGHSQGGQSAWAAAELAPQYAPELRLVAATAQAPAVNLRRLGVTSDGTFLAGEDWLMPLLITGLSVSAPQLDRWAYLRGNVRNDLPLLISCVPGDADRRQAAMDSITSEDVSPADDVAETKLADVLQDYSLPQRRTAVPMYILQGSVDPVVNSQSTTTAVRQACTLGSDVEYHILDGRNHDIGDDMSGYDWLQKVMNGTAPPTVCTDH